MTLIHEWGMPLAVLGMLSAALFAARLLSQYQAYRLLARSRIRRLEAGALGISEALRALRGVPLSRELRVIMRGEILLRHQKIRRLWRGYPNIGEQIRAAEAALQAEGGSGAGAVGPIEDEPAFQRTVRALNLLLAVMGPGGAAQRLPQDVRKILQRELGERWAEVMARFHMVQSRRFENAGNLTRARAHLTNLLSALRQYGPKTAFVNELCAETHAALAGLGSRQRMTGSIEGSRPAVGSGRLAHALAAPGAMAALTAARASS